MSEDPTQPFAALLAALTQPPTLKEVWYHRKEVKLDGYRFERCRFDQCKLYLTSANFTLEHCVIDAATLIVYGRDIVKPIRLFNSRNEWTYKTLPHFAPTRHDDGTISIST